MYTIIVPVVLYFDFMHILLDTFDWMKGEEGVFLLLTRLMQVGCTPHCSPAFGAWNYVKAPETLFLPFTSHHSP